MGWTAWFVPGAVAVQIVFLTAILLLARRENDYLRQVVLGTAASCFAAVPIAASSLIVGALAPDIAAAAGGLWWGALAGPIGTGLTGMVWSMLAAVVVRQRA